MDSLLAQSMANLKTIFLGQHHIQQDQIIRAGLELVEQGRDALEIVWDEAHETCQLLLNLLADLYKNAGELATEGSDDLEDSLNSFGDAYRRLEEADGERFLK